MCPCCVVLEAAIAAIKISLPLHITAATRSCTCLYIRRRQQQPLL
jgi:hypothetical protein